MLGGADNPVAWADAGWVHAHYGAAYGGSPYGRCTPADPYYHVGGSGWADDGTPLAMSATAISRPAEILAFSDGITIVRYGGFDMTIGCEAEKIHGEGGSFAMMDGHAKWVTRNIEWYEDTDAKGCVYTRYMSVDKP